MSFTVNAERLGEALLAAVQGNEGPETEQLELLAMLLLDRAYSPASNKNDDIVMILAKIRRFLLQ